MKKPETFLLMLIGTIAATSIWYAWSAKSHGEIDPLMAEEEVREMAVVAPRAEPASGAKVVEQTEEAPVPVKENTSEPLPVPTREEVSLAAPTPVPDIGLAPSAPVPRL